MSRTIELTIDGELEQNAVHLAQRVFPDNRFHISRYMKKALQEKVTRDLARLARKERADTARNTKQ